MYHEERMIDGVLMFRTDPVGEWEPCSIEDLSSRVVMMEAEIANLNEILDESR